MSGRGGQRYAGAGRFDEQRADGIATMPAPSADDRRELFGALRGWAFQKAGGFPENRVLGLSALRHG